MHRHGGSPIFILKGKTLRTLRSMFGPAFYRPDRFIETLNEIIFLLNLELIQQEFKLSLECCRVKRVALP